MGMPPTWEKTLPPAPPVDPSIDLDAVDGRGGPIQHPNIPQPGDRGLQPQRVVVSAHEDIRNAERRNRGKDEVLRRCAERRDVPRIDDEVDVECARELAG